MVTLSLLLLEERKTFDIRTLVQIDPIPKTKKLINAQKYADANEYLGYFMQYEYVNSDPKAVALLKSIEKKRASYEYKKNKLFEGIINGNSDENIGRVSAIASGFLVIGDIRDLLIQGNHYANHEKTDNLIVALSSLGILASASTLYSLGATTPVKSSISVLKYGRRVGKVPPWLSKQIIKEAKISRNSKSLKNLKELFEPVYRLYEKAGLNQALNLLKQTKSVGELKGMVKFSARFGKKSNILMQTTKQTALKYAKKMPKVKKENILYASTYGSKGLKALKRMGESKFLKRVKFTANLSKTTYKGNFDTLFTILLKKIPSNILFAITFLGLFYFIFKFSFLTRKILHLE